MHNYKIIFQKQQFPKLINLVIGIIFFSVFILFPPSPNLTKFLYKPDLSVFLLIIFLSILLFTKKERIWEIIQIIFVLILFAFPLIYEWQFAHHSDYSAISGLLPWSDASGHFFNAHLLSSGLNFDIFGTRRPLFSGFLSFLMYLTNRDLQVSLVLMTLMNALSVYFLVCQIRKQYDAPSAGIYLVLSYGFYRRFAGTILTEQLGFCLGNLSLFFFFVGAYSKNLKHILVGLGLLTLALNIRAGAFFILPALIIWMVVYFRKEKSFVQTLSLAIGVVIAGFLINIINIKLLGSKEGAIFSNYSYTLYGLASGGAGWTQFELDHPGIPETEILPLAIQKIQSNPNLFFQGIIGSYKDYFGGIFSFLSWLVDKKINLFLWALIILGLIYSWRHWRDGPEGIIIFSFLGIFFSIFLVAPRDADRMRAFAATIPFTILWVTAGIHYINSLVRKYSKRFEQNKNIEDDSQLNCTAFYFSIILLFCIILGPYIVRVFPIWKSSTQQNDNINPCPIGQDFLQGFRYFHTSVVLIPNNAASESYIPFIRIKDFQESVRGYDAYPFLKQELQKLNSGDQINYVMTYTPVISSAFLVTRSPLSQANYSTCARITENETLQSYNFYYKEGNYIAPSLLNISQEYRNLTLFMRIVYLVILIFIINFLILDILHIKLKSTAFLIIMLLCIPGIFIGVYSQGKLLIPAFQNRVVINTKDAVLEEGNSYFLHLNIDWKGQSQAEYDSSVIIYEEGIPLGRPNSSSQEISTEGDGHYFIQGNHLWFSSSDNTDPRVNDRLYEIEYPTPISRSFQIVFYSIPLISELLIINKTKHANTKTRKK